MALQGDIIWTTVEHSETETQDLVITYPDEMDVNDPNYDKKGTSETIQVPKENLKTNEYTNVYLYVKSIQMHTTIENNKKIEYIHYHYAGYESKEARDADNEDFLFFDSSQLYNYNHDLNLWSQCYNSLKEREQLKDLKDC
tara:strand:- start:12 stop:434 length:423 start_codon:yes stop_codon:yes gene_type:complete